MSAVRGGERFVRTQEAAVRARPADDKAFVRWLVSRFFATWFSTALTIVSVAFVLWAIPDILRYFIFDAVWRAPSGGGDLCRAPGAGACWAFVAQKLDYFRYGAYPAAQRWRVDAVMMFGAALGARLLWTRRSGGALRGFLFMALAPAVASLVTPGVSALIEHPWPDLALLASAIACAVGLWLTRFETRLAAILFFIVYPIVAFTLVRGTPALALPIVDTSLWGGLFVSLIVSIVGIVFSIPGGVVLALGRRSTWPAVRFCSIAFIEVVRGVPLITVLLMANTMLPLFVPAYLTPDRLARPLIGVSLFAAAYMAEVVRGGLQALPRGQFEGARALGLSSWKTMRLVVLPQALALSIPGIVNSCIALFKDTTLVAAVGLYDFLNTIDTAKNDPNWTGPSVTTTGYAFAALIYWIFCFGMSRYSRSIERTLRPGRNA